MRKWHRWISTVAALFLLFVASTGVLLHLDMMVRGSTPPGGEPPLPPGATVTALDGNALGQIVTRAVATAAATRPDLEVHRIEVSLLKGKPVVTIGRMSADGSAAAGIKVDGTTGQIIPPPPPKAKSYHYVLQDLHAGYFLGWTGRIISVLLGLSLITLAVTGLKLWLDMYSRRRQAGRKGLFWDR